PEGEVEDYKITIAEAAPVSRRDRPTTSAWSAAPTARRGWRRPFAALALALAVVGVLIAWRARTRMQPAPHRPPAAATGALPENPAPASLDDCVAAIRYIVANAAEFGADGSRFAIGGDSAGGNLTAASALRLRDEGGPKAKLLLLFYGAYTGDTTLPSVIENGEGKILTLKAMEWFYGHYLSGGASTDDPYIAPIKGDLKGLPPAHLIVGTQDPLLDDSKLFAEALEKAGVPAKLSIYQDQVHVFLQLTAMLDGAKKAMAESVDALKAALA
ncbi:MAG TPA: alpha/beta hydrolase, partial [Tepidiformaceae bacterium]|nr:alpha/beta hydrolase [Tepidiformaceae bacterium]